MSKKIEETLKQLYPHSPQLYAKLKKILQKYSIQDQEVQQPRWHKHFNMYVTYPDSFAEKKDHQEKLKTLTAKLKYIRNLGMDAVHILPFLESPLVDGGFDISNFKKIRKTLGNTDILDKLINEANKQDLRLFMDLVLNHVSKKHNWFKKALSGNEKYRNYFIHTDTKPKVVDIYKNAEGVWAKYNYNDKIVDTRIIFPKQVGPIPHWTKAQDGFWYYHTFYPHQIDINWYNPNVFLEFIDIIMYWASKGFNFRLDIILFVFKDIYNGKIESHPKVFKLLEILNYYLNKLSPDTVMLVESCQEINTIKKYFGNKNPRTHLAYNFPLMTALWIAILNGETKYIWDIIDKTYKDIPSWANWITFLRNHDELTFEYVDQKIRKNIFNKLKSKGLPFRNGFGVSGRTSSFLDNDHNKILKAYTLLASVPGNPALIYGDEIGKTNDLANMHQHTKRKQKLFDDNTIQNDTRDINRGYIKNEEIKSSKKLYMKMSRLFKARSELKSFFIQKPFKIKTIQGVFGIKYSFKQEVLLIFINLTNKPQTITYFKKNFSKQNIHPIFKINKPALKDKTLKLQPHSGIWIKIC